MGREEASGADEEAKTEPEHGGNHGTGQVQGSVHTKSTYVCVHIFPQQNVFK